MHWIALLPPGQEPVAWNWWALGFTPRVARVDEALLLEVSASERLWGGRPRLLRRLLQPERQPDGLEPVVHWAGAGTSLVALALLRLKLRGEPAPRQVPQGLPLHVLSAASEHVGTLARTGCTTWGQLRDLPRAGVARRFGAALVDALDAAWGERPERYPWLTLPEVFDVNLELPALAASAPELMWSGQRLLAQLQLWLRARQQGVLAVELEWALDLRRLDGVALPSHERLTVRTASPTQDMAHLRRLLGEHLARSRLAAPASHLRLRSLETRPWAGASTSLLPEDNVKGEKLHELVERLSVRLGEHNVEVPLALSDHRPERMQRWVPARHPVAGGAQDVAADALFPAWLLPRPLRLQVHNEVPHYGGPLRRLTHLYRVETGWWEPQGPALRDYFLARSEGAGLVWIYRERPASLARGLEPARQFHWYLQGLYA